MKRKEVVVEYSRKAAARLQGHVQALEFIQATSRQQLVREQALIARLASAVSERGMRLEDVFSSEDVYHIQQCMKIHLDEKPNADG